MSDRQGLARFYQPTLDSWVSSGLPVINQEPPEEFLNEFPYFGYYPIVFYCLGCGQWKWYERSYPDCLHFHRTCFINFDSEKLDNLAKFCEDNFMYYTQENEETTQPPKHLALYVTNCGCQRVVANVRTERSVVRDVEL